MKRSVFALVAFAAVLASCAEDPPPPDVFFIVCDTLRADHMGCYGYPRDTTPNLDALAVESTRFDMAITSAPATMPAMWNMMLSEYQAEVPSPDDDVTLAEFFKAQGYRTGGFVAQRFLRAGMSNLNQGFDRYDDEQVLEKAYMTTLRQAGSVTEAAIEWLDEGGEQPNFMWLVYFDPHDPYLPPPTTRGVFNDQPSEFTGDRRALGLMKDAGPTITPEHRQFFINAYDEEILYMDRELGRFLDHLRATERFENAVIVFTSDHGEELGDNGGRWDHSQLLSQEELHVPLLVKLPGKPVVSSVAQPVQNIDIYPTLVDLVDPESKLLGGLDGTSLLPLVRGQLQPGRLAFALWENQVACFDTAHKYWLVMEPNGTKELVTELESGRPVEDREIARELNGEVNSFISTGGVSNAYWSESVQQLMDLGYFTAAEPTGE